MRRRGLADGTIYTRTCDLRRWLDHVGERWPSATRHDVDAWLDGRPLAARARYTAISHLSMFYRWAIREELATVDPTMAVERPKLPRRLPRPVPGGQLARLIAGGGPYELWILLMADAGLRCCEVARLRWRDIDLEAGTILVNGKGDRDRLVGVPRRLRMALYLAEAEASTEWITRRPITPARVSQLIGAHARTLGLAGVTAHRLRHTYATRLYEATGGDLGAVQKALGHVAVTSTQIYAFIDPARAIAAARLLDGDAA